MFPPRHLLIRLPILISLFGPSVSGQSPETEPIRVTSSLVLVDIRAVNNKTGKAIPGLTADDFEVFEDGVRQDITHFSQDKLPISVVLLLDVSGSMQPVIDELRADALEALHHLKREDEVALIAYGSSAQLVQDFTADRKLIVDGIARINDSYLGWRGTALSEAVFQAAVHLARAASFPSRRIIVTVTDDVSNEYPWGHRKQQALAQIMESSASLYGLAIMNEAKKSRERLVRRLEERGSTTSRIERAMVHLNDFSEPTGGTVLPTTFGNVPAKLGDLLDAIRSCYSLGYPPSTPPTDGRLRKLRVRLTHGVLDPSTGKEFKPAVVARTGYFAGRVPKTTDMRAPSYSFPRFLGGSPEQQMFQALHLNKELEDFHTTISASRSANPSGGDFVRLTAWVDPASVEPRLSDGRYASTLAVLALVFNEPGMIVADYRSEYRLSFDKAQYQTFKQMGSSLNVDFSLFPGKYELRIVFREVEAGKMSSHRINLEVIGSSTPSTPPPIND